MCIRDSHISTLSYQEIDQVGSATLVTRMTSDINQVQSGVNLVLRLFLRSPFIVVGAVVMAFTVNFRLAWIFVVAVPLLSIVIYGIMMITIPIYKKVQKGLDQILLTTRENLAGIRVIRAFRTQKEEQDVYKRQGFTMEELLQGSREQRMLLEKLDVLIDGPYIEEQRSLSLAYRGSRNQRIIDVPAKMCIRDSFSSVQAGLS